MVMRQHTFIRFACCIVWRACRHVDKRRPGVKASEKNIGNCIYCIQYFLHLVLFPLCAYLWTAFVLHVLLSSYVYLLHNLCIAVLTLDNGLLARSQYPEGPATGHLDTGFSWFPLVYKRKLRWFPSYPVATTCFSCSPPEWNFLVT
jgi:hypothetical protein